MDTNKKSIHFTITFSIEEWKSILPRPKTYEETCRARTYLILKPFDWSNLVQEHFFLHTGLSCSLTFKKARVSEFGKNYISVRGQCKECHSLFLGNVEEVPAVDARLVDFKFNHN